MILTLLLAVTPSVKAFVSSNGYGTLQYSVADKRFDRFLQHPYKYETENVPTRDLLEAAGFDVEGAGEPSVAYEPGTGIIAVTRYVGDNRVVTYGFAPRGLGGAAFVLVLQADTPVHVRSYLNTRLGPERPEPAGFGEYIQYTDQGFEEYGPFQQSAAVACSRALPEPDSRNFPMATGGDELVPTFEWQSTTSVALLVSYDHGNIAGDAWGRLNRWLGEVSDPAALLERERAAWNDTQVPLDGATSEEQALYRQSLAILKMAQVQESGRSKGQILASLAASTSNEWTQWNVTWVRDMAYATAALAEAGQFAEAREALRFQLQAQSGRFVDYVKKPYQISVCRYFGDGREESDANENGFNIEFDGFGLFLWSLGVYVRESGDKAFVETYRQLLQDQVGDVLVSLIEPYSGLIRADSSIWETHWNGHERQFGYTSITAVAGLCALADLTADAAKAREYRNSAKRIRAAIHTQLVGSDKVIASSREERSKGKDYYDAAVIEAVTLGLIDPHGEVAQATAAALRDKLSSGDGRGVFRNDEGDEYDKQEWVLVNLRLSQAAHMAGESGDDIWNWVVAQSVANGNIIAELYAASDASYSGSVPMVGFGAGAYVLAANARYGVSTVTPACGGFDDTPEEEPDATAQPEAEAPASHSEKSGCGSVLPIWWMMAIWGLFLSKIRARSVR